MATPTTNDFTKYLQGLARIQPELDTPTKPVSTVHAHVDEPRMFATTVNHQQTYTCVGCAKTSKTMHAVFAPVMRCHVFVCEACKPALCPFA